MDIEHIFREESGRILATLIRLLGSFDLAEEVMQEAFTIALEQWPSQGTPANPRAWLVSTAQHKGVDLLRRRARFDSKREELQKWNNNWPERIGMMGCEIVKAHMIHWATTGYG